jgi:large subunit ribosomal protein L10
VTRDEKEKHVAWLHEQFEGIAALFLTDFQGLTVSELNRLRSELRDRGINFKVLKNTLTRLAYKDTDVFAVADKLVGPRAAAWTRDRNTVPSMAKVLVDFAKSNPKLGLIGGVLNGKTLEASQLETLSTLPSREELLSKLFGTMIAPVGAFVGVLAAVPRSLLTVLKAIGEKRSPSPELEA